MHDFTKHPYATFEDAVQAQERRVHDGVPTTSLHGPPWETCEQKRAREYGIERYTTYDVSIADEPTSETEDGQ